MLTYNSNRRQFSGYVHRFEVKDRMRDLTEAHSRLLEESWIRAGEKQKRLRQAEKLSQQMEDLRPVLIAANTGEHVCGFVEFQDY